MSSPVSRRDQISRSAALRFARASFRRLMRSGVFPNGLGALPAFLISIDCCNPEKVNHTSQKTFLENLRLVPRRPRRPVQSITIEEGSGTELDALHFPGVSFISAKAIFPSKEPSTTRQPTQPGGFVPENISSVGICQSIFQPMIWPSKLVTTPKSDFVTLVGVKTVSPSVKLNDNGVK
jgi:hypothetical protein